MIGSRVKSVKSANLQMSLHPAVGGSERVAALLLQTAIALPLCIFCEPDTAERRHSDMCETVTHRFLGLGAGQRRGRDVGPLLQK